MMSHMHIVQRLSGWLCCGVFSITGDVRPLWFSCRQGVIPGGSIALGRSPIRSGGLTGHAEAMFLGRRLFPVAVAAVVGAIKTGLALPDMRPAYHAGGVAAPAAG